MTSLAFILNPLDRNGGSSVAAVSTASSKRPLPALAAAIAPSSFAAGWTNGCPPSYFHLPGLLPLTTIAAHRLAMDASLHQFATATTATTATTTRSYAEPAELTQRKKQRLQYIATKYAEHEDNGGATSPTTSSEDELSSSDDVDADGDHEGQVTPQSSKKKTRLCKEKGCTSLAVSRRSCVRHGGGSRCTFDGCTNGAKLRNRCFQHGGSTICLADGCESKAKRYGYCWSHGGGRICSTEGCVKVAAQGGSCWAHGGGNRCKLEGCSKRSYQKHGYYCKAHAAYNI